MGEVKTLRLVNKAENPNLLEQFDKEAADMRANLEANPDSGFVMIRYSRVSENEVSHSGGYFFHDVMDRFWLPHFLAEKCRALIHGNGMT